MKIKLVAIATLYSVVATSVLGPEAQASRNCRSTFRNRFYYVTAPIQAIKDALHAELKIEGGKPKIKNARVAQSAKVKALLAEYRRRAKELAKEKKISEDAAFDELAKQLEVETVEAMKSKKTYPDIETMLSVMAFKSPTFRHELFLFLENHTSVKWQYRWKLMAHFAESAHPDNLTKKVKQWWVARKLDEYNTLLQDPDLAPDLRASYEKKFLEYFEKEKKIEDAAGFEVTKGRKFYYFWVEQMQMPARKPQSIDAFHSMLAQFSDVLFAVNHPQPYWATWSAAFTRAPWDASVREVMRRFADQMAKDHRARYKSFLEGVSVETYGKPRPEVLHDLYQFGLLDTMTRRIVAIVKERHAIWGEIEKKPGTFNKLKTGLNKALDDDIVLKREIEQLTLEAMYVMKPIITAMFAYAAYQLLDAHVLDDEKEKAHEEDLKFKQQNPDLVVPSLQNKKATSDMLKGLEDQIDGFTASLREHEENLKSGKLEPEEEARIKDEIQHLERKIQLVTKMKEQKLRTMNRLKPNIK